jgi:hypothetical protein
MATVQLYSNFYRSANFFFGARTSEFMVALAASFQPCTAILPDGLQQTLPDSGLVLMRPPLCHPFMRTSQMNPKVQLFVKSMDEQNWVRLLVGFGPGLVIGKLATQIGSTGLSIASGVVLAAGMGVYLAWPIVRAKMPALDAADTESETEVRLVHEREVARPVERQAAPETGASQAEAMAALVKLCDGRADRALELVNVELSVDPNQTYASALERALRRQELFAHRT